MIMYKYSSNQGLNRTIANMRGLFLLYQQHHFYQAQYCTESDLNLINERLIFLREDTMFLLIFEPKKIDVTSLKSPIFNVLV